MQHAHVTVIVFFLMILLCVFICAIARGVDMEAANAKFKPTKAKALKVLDGKSAQNICESVRMATFVCVCDLNIPSLVTVSHAVGYPS